METTKNHTVSEDQIVNNPIYQMVKDKKRIAKAIKNGEKISNIKGIKIVSPL
jgi:hypothetical protein